MLRDPLLNLAQGFALRHLRGQLGTELSLVAGTSQEHHEVPGDGQRRVTTEVLLDQRQGQVDTGGHPGRGRDIAVPDETRLCRAHRCEPPCSWRVPP